MNWGSTKDGGKDTDGDSAVETGRSAQAGRNAEGEGQRKRHHSGREPAEDVTAEMSGSESHSY